MSHPMNRATPSRLRHIVTLTATLAATALLSLAAHAQSVEGEVKRIDPDSGKVTLKHGEIKNLEMPGMTMVFQVKDPSLLKNLKAGDKVRFAADRVNGAITVTEIQPAS